MQEVETKLLANVVLQNRYKICELIEIGPISRLYSGFDLKKKKNVFIKELIITSYKDPYMRQQAIEQFKSEAKILFNLKHKNLPRFLEYFDQRENRYIIMEFVNGYRLNTIVEKNKGFLPDIKVIDWSVELCDVLSYLHNIDPYPVIFRDMRPQAIIITQEGTLKLIDFGISKVYADHVQTRDIIKIVIPHYSPLEQHSGGTDMRSDIYSLGATMYYLITKVPPMDSIERSFRDEAIKKCSKINPLVSPELERIILKSMEIDKKNRYQYIDEMKEDLIRLSDDMKRNCPKSSQFQEIIKELEQDLLLYDLHPDNVSSHKMENFDTEHSEKDVEEEFSCPFSGEKKDEHIRDKNEDKIEIIEDISEKVPLFPSVSILPESEEALPPEFNVSPSPEHPVLHEGNFSLSTENPVLHEGNVSLSTEDSFLPEGKVIKVRYEIKELIHEHYLTRIYKAMDIRRNHIIVIKEFLSDKLFKINPSEQVMEEIHRHARTLVYLEHPNLPSFYNYFNYEGKNYLVMDYIEGKNLKYPREYNSLISWKKALEWSMQLCDVLHYLHRRRPYPVIFRLLSPCNIIMEETGILKLIDPGISRLYKFSAGIESEPEEKQFFSPEEYSGTVDVRSDIYCLGITLYYILTGTIPYSAEDRMNYNLSLERELFPGDVPVEFIEIILKASEINKNKRFQNILQMKEALEFFMEFNIF